MDWIFKQPVNKPIEGKMQRLYSQEFACHLFDATISNLYNLAFQKLIPHITHEIKVFKENNSDKIKSEELESLNLIESKCSELESIFGASVNLKSFQTFQNELLPLIANLTSWNSDELEGKMYYDFNKTDNLGKAAIEITRIQSDQFMAKLDEEMRELDREDRRSYYDDFEEYRSRYCRRCQERPCQCSDPT